MEKTKKLTQYELAIKKEYFKRYYQLHRETLLQRAKDRNSKKTN